MALAPRLDLRQSQSLVMTPQLQQAIKLLTLSNLEVESFIAAELEKNPLLETAGDDGELAPDEPDEAFADDQETAEPEPPTTDQLIALGDGIVDTPLDVDLVSETFHHDGPTDSASGGSGDAIDFDAFAATAPSLTDHLLAQAGACLSGPDLIVAGHLIDLIDATGYLYADPREVAERLGVS